MDDAIVLRQLPNNLRQIAESKITNIISPDKILSSDWDNNGLRVVLKDYDQFKKVLLENFLLLNGKRFNIQPLVVPLTIYDVEQYVKESVLFEELRSIFKIYNLHPEKRNNIKTGNYRIMINVLNDEDFKPPNHLFLACRKEPFNVDYYCRNCRENGHSEYCCIMSQNLTMPEQVYNLRSTSSPVNIEPCSSQSAYYNEPSTSSAKEKQKDYCKQLTTGNNKRAKIPKKRTPTSFVSAAMRATEIIMDTSTFKAFLDQIEGRKYPAQQARKLGIDIKQVIRKLEAVEDHYNKSLQHDTAEIGKLRKIKKRLYYAIKCKNCV